MAKRIVILQGHPDTSSTHFGHALASVYAEGATGAGHSVETIHIATIDFPLLRNQQEWQTGELPAALHEAQNAIGVADHLVIVFPLWLGDMPALLKAFFEQVFRPGFAFLKGKVGMGGKKPLAGKSARIIVTMGMPGFFYRIFFRAHSLKNLERNILKFVGFKPVKSTVIGVVEGKASHREKWLQRVRRLGEQGK